MGARSARPDLSGVVHGLVRTVAAGLAVLAVVAGGPAEAGVNLKNGNFYISYTDLIAGQPELSLTRTYNSRSSKTLLFGKGWGSFLDTALTVNGDGSVTVQEIGSGMERLYVPPDRTGAALQALLDRMLAAMEGAGWIASDAVRASARTDLASSAETRRNLQRQLVREGLIAPAEIAAGERLVSASEAGVVVTREAGGFYRRSAKGFERFGLDGRLAQSVEDGKAPYELRRDAAGNLREIVGRDGTVIAVQTGAGGRITRVETAGRAATFIYDSGNHLIQSTDTAGNVFVFEYDDQSNMTAIRYADGTARLMAYDDKDKLVSQEERDGRLTTYEYGDYPLDEPGIVEHYFTRVKTFAAGERETPNSDDLTAYRIGVDAFGNSYTAGILRRQNGVETETRYHPCGQPILQRRGSRQNVYDYDSNCRMTLKRSGDTETRLTYDQRSGKITRVVNADLAAGTSEETRFTYDLRFNLVAAENDRGRRVALVYDGDNRIATMTDQDGQTLAFTYNDAGKPVRIEIVGEGAITVEYDSAGEISKVETDGDGGSAMALRVTQAFQALLALVKPAGVNFNL